MVKLYDKASSKFESELGIEKIVKSLRDLKIYHKKTIDQKSKFLIQHNYRNVINLDEESSGKDEPIRTH